MADDLLPALELEPELAPNGSVIWLHGLGADGNDFVPIMNELRLPAGLRLRFVFPHAPVRPVTINGGYPMRAWYDIIAANLSERADAAGVRASALQIEALIAREKARGIAASRILLAGFSQGGVIALHTALRHSERLAGVIALSTYLVLADTLPAEASPANRDVPILMAHGRDDPVVLLQWAELSRAALVRNGYTVEWHTYPMQHSVSWEEVRDVSQWMVRVLRAT